MATLVLLIGFCARILYIRAFYIVAYAYFIYALNLFLAFLTPRFDPAAQASELSTTGKSESGGDTAILPVKGDDEFRPFVRRLPEFKFWLSATKATLIASICTLIPPLNVPVFWPILVVYFAILFMLTMKRQIKHMIKYKYVPFDFGKKKYPPSAKSSR